MRHKLNLSALLASFLTAAAPAAFAQNAGAAGAGSGTAPGTGGVPPVGTSADPGSAGVSSAPGGSSTTTGMGTTTGLRQPGAPNTTVLGTIGTGASPSGLPGDDPAHPGFPGRVGQ